MARPPKPWYWEERDGWYVTIEGKRHPLAKGHANKKEADKEFHRLMVEGGRPQAKKRLRACEVIDLFLDHSHRVNKPNTYEQYRIKLQDFCDHHGSLPAESLKPLHITAWLKAHPDWSRSTQRCAITAAKVAFKWAADQGFIPASPFASVKRPRQTRRTEVLSASEQRKIFDAVEDEAFRDYLFALTATGARPGEVRRVTAAHCRLDLGVWVMPPKNENSDDEPRVIPLTPQMVELSRRLSEKNPAGPLFRNTRGKPWTANAVRCRFRNLRAKLGLEAGAVAYAYRHRFGSNAVQQGLDGLIDAKMMGHRDTKMLMDHYLHLNAKAMRDAAEKVSPGEG